jgi:hypothetical protein
MTVTQDDILMWCGGAERVKRSRRQRAKQDALIAAVAGTAVRCACLLESKQPSLLWAPCFSCELRPCAVSTAAVRGRVHISRDRWLHPCTHARMHVLASQAARVMLEQLGVHSAVDLAALHEHDIAAFAPLT